MFVLKTLRGSQASAQQLLRSISTQTLPTLTLFTKVTAPLSEFNHSSPIVCLLLRVDLVEQQNTGAFSLTFNHKSGLGLFSSSPLSWLVVRSGFGRRGRDA